MQTETHINIRTLEIRLSENKFRLEKKNTNVFNRRFRVNSQYKTRHLSFGLNELDKNLNNAVIIGHKFTQIQNK